MNIKEEENITVANASLPIYKLCFHYMAACDATLSLSEGLATQSHKNEEKTVFEVIHLLQKVHKGQRICFIKGLKV